MQLFLRLLYTVLLSVASFGVSYAQQAGLLRGTVRDEAGTTIPGAFITRINTEKQFAETDINGKYSLELLPGEHTLFASASGMINDTFTVNIFVGQITEKDITLKTESKELDVVVISAGKFEQNIEDVTVSMEVIKPALVENKNTTSIETALEQAPGLTILDQEPQIRGGSGFTFGVGSRVAIVVDGMPLLSGDAGRPEWGFIPVENLDQIEIIKGASSVLYGSSALSGIINIRTAYPKDKPLTQLNFTTGLYNEPGAPGQSWWGNTTPLYSGLSGLHMRKIKNHDITVGGNFFYDVGYIGPPQIVDTNVIDTITNFTNEQVRKYRGRINFSWRYHFKKVKGLTFSLSANGMLSHSNFALAWLNDSSGLYRAYPGAISLQDQVIFYIDPILEYFHPKGHKHILRTRVFRTDNTITNNQSNESTLFYGEYQFQRSFSFIPKFIFTAGVVASGATSKAQLYSGSGTPQNSITNVAGYSQFDKKFWTILNVSAGLRFEYFNMNGTESAVKPVFRMGANLRVLKGTWLRYSYGQGYRFPTITERYILTNTGSFGVFPNPGLQPETSTSFELGIKQGIKIKKFMGYIDLAGFNQEYHNTIEYLFGLWDMNVAPVGFKFLNTGDTRVRGVDVSFMGQLKTDKKLEITFLMGYTYVQPVALQPHLIYAKDNAPGGARDLSYITTSLDTSDYILKYRFEHTGKGDVQITYGRFSIGYSGRIYSNMRNIDKAFEELEVLTWFAPNYSDIFLTEYWKENRDKMNYISDARIGYEVSKGIKIAIVCNNLMNKVYMLRPMKIEPPRTVALQVIWKF